MTKIFNKISLKDRRRELRINSVYTERKLWHYLRNKQIQGFKFRRQHSIDNYIIDFYCPALKFAIEVDGISHLDTKQYDNIREKDLFKLGINMLHINGYDVLHNIENVLIQINNKVNEIKTSPNPSFARRGKK